ncbi:hypothetical protein BDZ97DRAFT_1409948 [Flammula alnicola]|nr:hypothetical protein BDZ97DRAFT_1409948 [Flammula alnicola]
MHPWTQAIRLLSYSSAIFLNSGASFYFFISCNNSTKGLYRVREGDTLRTQYIIYTRIRTNIYMHTDRIPIHRIIIL